MDKYGTDGIPGSDRRNIRDRQAELQQLEEFAKCVAQKARSFVWMNLLGSCAVAYFVPVKSVSLSNVIMKKGIWGIFSFFAGTQIAGMISAASCSHHMENYNRILQNNANKVIKEPDVKSLPSSSHSSLSDFTPNITMESPSSSMDTSTNLNVDSESIYKQENIADKGNENTREGTTQGRRVTYDELRRRHRAQYEASRPTQDYRSDLGEETRGVESNTETRRKRTNFYGDEIE